MAAGAVLAIVAIGVVAVHAANSVDINPSLPGMESGTDPAGIVANLYQFALLLGGILAFGSIVYGGIRYTLAAGNSSTQGDARDQITQALLGLLLLFGVYLIFSIINPGLTVLGLPSLAPLQIPVPSGGHGTASTLTDPQAKAQLSAEKVDVKVGVDLTGVSQRLLVEMGVLRQACGTDCNVTLTSGTEGTHSERTSCNHANGYKVDLGLNSKITDYIVNNLKYVGQRSSDGAPQYKNEATGSIYARESNHWDVAGPCP